MYKSRVLISYYENIYNTSINGYEVSDYNNDTVLFSGSYDECVQYTEDNDMLIMEEVWLCNT